MSIKVSTSIGKNITVTASKKGISTTFKTKKASYNTKGGASFKVGKKTRISTGKRKKKW